MRTRRLTFRQLLALVGCVALISPNAFAKRRPYCPQIFGVSSTKEVSQIPAVAEDGKSDEVNTREQITTSVEKLTRLDLQDSQKFLKNLGELSKTMGLKPEYVKELSELFIGTGILGGDIHLRSYLLSSRNMARHLPWNYNIAEMKKKNFYFSDYTSRKTIDRLNESVLSPHTEEAWARSANETARRMAEITVAMVEASYPRTVGTREKQKLIVRNLGIHASAAQIEQMDRLIAIMSDWKSKSLLQYMYKATLPNIAVKARDKSDPLMTRILNTAFFTGIGPVLAFESLVGLANLPLNASGWVLLAHMGGGLASAGISVMNIGYAVADDYTAPWRIMRPFTYLGRMTKSLAPWVDAKFQQKEIQRIVLGAGPRSKLLANLKSKLGSSSSDVSLLDAPKRKVSTYDIANPVRRQSLALQAATSIMPDADESSPSLYTSFENTIFSHEASMAAADLRLARNEVTIAVEFAERTLNEQLLLLNEMNLKMAELRLEPLKARAEKSQAKSGLLEDAMQMSTMSKTRELVKQMGEQRDDVRYSLKVLRIQITKLKKQIETIDSYLAQKGSDEDLALMRQEFASLQSVATDLYVAKTDELSSLLTN